MGKCADTKTSQRTDFQINKEGKGRMKVAATKRRALPASVDRPSDYYYRFKRFCSFYPLREQHLACSILDAMGKLPRSQSSSFSILDVGSSDGTLLAEVIGILRASSNIDLHCVAVEPDPIAFARLEVTATLLRKQWKVTIDCIQASIEDVIGGRELYSKVVDEG
jgi:hypothetical protein